jgi:hypothetical protein
MPHPTRRAFAKLAATAICCVAVVYPLSYAPYMRWDLDRACEQGWFYPVSADGEDYPAYKPADWLIDNTPFDKPLFAWASLWGVGDQFQSAARRR